MQSRLSSGKTGGPLPSLRLQENLQCSPDFHREKPATKGIAFADIRSFNAVPTFIGKNLDFAVSLIFAISFNAVPTFIGKNRGASEFGGGGFSLQCSPDFHREKPLTSVRLTSSAIDSIFPLTSLLFSVFVFKQGNDSKKMLYFNGLITR